MTRGDKQFTLRMFLQQHSNISPMDNKTERIVSLVSRQELERIQKAADKHDRSLSSFLRLAALKLATDGCERRPEELVAR